MKNKKVVIPGFLIFALTLFGLSLPTIAAARAADYTVWVGGISEQIPAGQHQITTYSTNGGYSGDARDFTYVYGSSTQGGEWHFEGHADLVIGVDYGYWVPVLVVNKNGGTGTLNLSCSYDVNGSTGTISQEVTTGATALWDAYADGPFNGYVDYACVITWESFSGGNLALYVNVDQAYTQPDDETTMDAWWVDPTAPTATPTGTPGVTTDLLEDGNMEEYPTSSAWDTWEITGYLEDGYLGRFHDISGTITDTAVMEYLGPAYCDGGYNVVGGLGLTVSGTEIVTDPGNYYLAIEQDFDWAGGELYWRFAARAGAAGAGVPASNSMALRIKDTADLWAGALTPGWEIYEGSVDLPGGSYTLQFYPGLTNLTEYHFIDDVQLGEQPPTGHCGGGTGIGGQDEYSLLVDGGFELAAVQGMQYWIKLPAYSDWGAFGRSIGGDDWWYNTYGPPMCGSQYQIVHFDYSVAASYRKYPVRQRFNWPGGRLYYQLAARGDYDGAWGLGASVGVYLTGSSGTIWLEENRAVDADNINTPGSDWVWLVGSKYVPAGEYYLNLNQGAAPGMDPSGEYDLEFDEVAIGPKPFSGTCYTNGGPITPTPAGTKTATPTLNATSGLDINIGDCSFENFNEFWIYAPGSWWTDYDYSPNQYILGEYFAVADGELPKPIYQTVFIPRSGMVRARFWSKSTYQLILVPQTELSVPIVLGTGGTYSGDLGAWQEIVTDPVWVQVPAAGMYADLVLSRHPDTVGVYTLYTAMYDGIKLNVGPAPSGAVPGICGATNTPGPTYTPAPTLTPQGTFTATPSTRTPGPPGGNVADCDRKCSKPGGFGLDWVSNWLDYERCQIEYYAAWCPFHSATLAAVPTTFAGKQPFGMIVEVEESRATIEAQVGQYDWGGAGIPGMEDQPDPSMFLVRTATPQGRVAAFYRAESTQYVSPYEGGQIMLSSPAGQGESGEAVTYSTYCNVQMSDVIGSRLAVGACFGFNILRQLALLPWFQLFVNLCSILALYFYIKTAWIDKGMG